MSAKQKSVEKGAVAKLTHAQQLLMANDNNVDEAQRLRDEVVNKDLPKSGMYISATDPKSLLADVDARIRRARIRLRRAADAKRAEQTDVIE